MTVKDSSADSTGKVVANGTQGHAFTAAYNSILTLEEGVDVESTGSCSFVYNGATLNTAANLTSTLGIYTAITGNGSAGHAAVEFNITGGTITAPAGGVYFPNKGTLNISGGTITGDVGVYVKSGTTNISGDASITGNGPKTDYAYNGNGFNSTGDALVVDFCNYPGGEPSVNITGGTFTSENASAVASYKNNGVATDPSIKISGGTFSNEVPEEFCAEGYRPVDNGKSFSVHKHSAEYVSEKAATCTEDGMKEHYYCASCEKYFSDENCTVEVTKESLIIPKLPHTLEAIAEKPAACTEEGIKAHYYCAVCGKYFSVEAGTVEVTAESLIIPKVAHVYKDGKCTVCNESDPNYVAGANDSSSVANNAESTNTSVTDSPKTGDNGNILFLVMVSVSAVGIAVVINKKNRYAKHQ